MSLSIIRQGDACEAELSDEEEEESEFYPESSQWEVEKEEEQKVTKSTLTAPLTEKV